MHWHVKDDPFRLQVALLPSQLLETHGSTLLHPPEEKAFASAVSSHCERMPTLKVTAACLRADELHACGRDAPPAFATKPQASECKKAGLPRSDDVVSVCMLALALLNKEEAENTKLDDVLSEHQRDGLHCGEI